MDFLIDKYTVFKICSILFVMRHLDTKEMVKQNYKICDTDGCLAAADKLLKLMIPRFDPCNDFYKFVCGEYVKTTKIPDDKAVMSTMTELTDEVTRQLQDLLDEDIQESEPRHFQLAKKIYRLCLDTEAIERKGVDFLKDYITSFGGWPVIVGNSWDQKAFNWVHATQKMFDNGFSTDAILNVYITVNATNTNQRIIEIDQVALSVDREHLMRGLRSHVVKAYYNYMVDIALMFGADNATVRKELLKVIRFERKLANITVRIEDQRNHTMLSNPIRLHELQAMHHYFQWREYIRYLMPDHMKLKILWEEVVNLRVPSYFVKLEPIVKKTKRSVLGNYLMWRAIQEKISFLPEKFRERRLKFIEEVTGKKKYSPRREICANTASSMLDLAVSAMYVRKHFKDSVKEKAGVIVESLLQEVVKLINSVAWMDEQTRKFALKKAKTIFSHVAYPVELKDDNKLEKFYEKLNITEDDLFMCANNICKFENDLAISLLRKRINKTDWTDHGDAAIVNAFFDPTENSIEIPAGILQGLCFDSDRPMYMNYGGIGGTIAHEMTHAFDDEGRQFDKDGNLAEWWDEHTKLLYLEKANQTIKHYSNYSVKKVKLNGVNCQGEAIADHGGIKLAYNAYEAWVAQHGEEPRLAKLEMYTPKQMFWITYASTYCTVYRPLTLKLILITDCHPPNDLRVNIPLRNQEAFAKDFNCSVRSYMNPPVKYNVWIKASDKVRNIDMFVSYPEEFLDDSKLETYFEKLQFESGNNFVENLLAIRKFNKKIPFNLHGTFANKTDWKRTDSVTNIYAYYKPHENTVFIPAALLQEFYIHEDRPMYLNYGALASLIAHEILHSLDTDGQLHDKHGNARDILFSEETRDRYQKKAIALSKHYSSYTVEEVKMKLDGLRTKEEGIMDQAGLKIAHASYKSWINENGEDPLMPLLEKYTPLQLFWVSFAITHCARMNPKELKSDMESDEHPPAEFRVNIPLRNLKVFAKDFHCPVGSFMNPSTRYSVW